MSIAWHTYLPSSRLHRRALCAGLSLFSGLLMGFCFPGHILPGVWLFYLVPLYLALDLVRRFVLGWKRWLEVVLLCWLAGAGAAVVSGGWVVNTSELFGHLPYGVALLISWVGYGGNIGWELFGVLAIPFLLSWHRPRAGFLLCVLWGYVAAVWWPRLLLFFSFGQAMLEHASLLQIADIGGSAILNIPLLGLQLGIYGMIRGQFFPQEVTLNDRTYFVLIWSGVFAQVALYGHWRLKTPLTDPQHQVQLVGIQPDFSLKHLSSNPARTPGDRRRSLQALLDDSTRALERIPAANRRATVVLWPESTYPHAPYREHVEVRERLRRWVGAQGVQLVLASQLVEQVSAGADRRYSVSVHVPADGGAEHIYKKMVLIPFGERMPLADTRLGRWIAQHLPYASQFSAGQEATTFSVAEGVELAPLICFDALHPRVARRFRAAGANMGVVLANLAWFGRTSVSRQFEQAVRFRAIETRMPMLMLSQNGRSVMFDARGELGSEILPAYERGALLVTAAPTRTSSVYVRYGSYLEVIAALLCLVLLALLWHSHHTRFHPQPYTDDSPLV